MTVWVLIFYIANGPIVIDNIRTQVACEALASTVVADVFSLNNTLPPHRCVAVLKR